MTERLTTNGHLPDVKVLGPDGVLKQADEVGLVCMAMDAVFGRGPQQVWGSRDVRDRNSNFIKELEDFFSSRGATRGFVEVVEEEGSPWLLIVPKG